MTGNIFQEVKDGLQSRLADVVQDLLPGGRVSGKEYLCGSLQGGSGESCRTSLETGVGSDFATGESWPDIIGLAAKVWNSRQGEAAKELGKLYGIGQDYRPPATSNAAQPAPATFRAIQPIPQSAPEPPRHHPQHGKANQMWCYKDTQGRAQVYVARFDLEDGKTVLPLCYGQYGANRPQWAWKALPEPRPLYGLPKLAAMPDALVLLVEGEKTADAAQDYFPHHAALTWSGGAKAVSKADFSPLQGRKIIIWPDTGESSVRMRLQELVDTAIKGEPTLSDFAARLAAYGVEIRLNEANTGRVSGISFALDGVAMKGSDLGRGYTWNSLQKKGLHHEIGKNTGDELGRGQEKERGLGPGYAAGRAGDHGNARGLAQQTGNDAAAKQRRIDENFARLEQATQGIDLGHSKERQRSKGLSR